MKPQEMIKKIEQAGTKIDKNKLIDALRKATEKDLPFVRDDTGKYALVRLPLR